ncbi:MAG: excinuclease ABC subunit C [Sphingobacteriales bacterium]|nr:MAG: excinuclease ABC subunit C [Sphingobacteriales bacterium]
MTKEQFQKIAASVPHQPGCYKYFSATDELLYVGKAKDLRKRVASYFNKNVDNHKTRRLVQLIHRLEFTITGSEHDAFLLENSLIKHYQPRFNIDLKDDKTYPYIVIKKEHFPRVFLTRRLIRDGSEYLGPFTGVQRVRELLEVIKQNIPLRTCNLNLAPSQIAKNKYKVCLEYHLGNCKGPCQALQSEPDYADGLQQVRHILKGHTGEVVKFLKGEMQQAAENLEFEKAEQFKAKITSLQAFESRSTVVNPALGNLDVIALLTQDALFFVSYMMVVNGSVIYTRTIEIERKTDEEEDADVLALALARLRETYQSNSREVIAPMEIDLAEADLKLTIPKVGDKKKLLDLCFKNADYFAQDRRRKDTLLLNTKPVEAGTKNPVLVELQQSLSLPVLPVHIECFDNSNFQGSYPVSAMVCFRNGQPAKQDYRHYNVKTVVGINDFASMAEVVERRYRRLTAEGKSLPQLVIIDGGKGQLSAAMESIRKLGLEGQMTVIGLAKREESVFFPGDSEPINLPFDSPAHLLIRRIRDEVHNFGITFHRKLRSAGTFKNELEGIPGIGAKTATELLQRFRSVAKVKTLTERELTGAVGQSKAALVYRYFHGAGKENDE